MRKSKTTGEKLYDSFVAYCKRRRAELEADRQDYAMMAMCGIEKSHSIAQVHKINDEIRKLSPFAPDKATAKEIESVRRERSQMFKKFSRRRPAKRRGKS